MKVHLADRDSSNLEFVHIIEGADAEGVVEIPDDTASFLKLFSKGSSSSDRFTVLPPIPEMDEDQKRLYGYEAHATLHTLYFQSSYD